MRVMGIEGWELEVEGVGLCWIMYSFFVLNLVGSDYLFE